MTVCAPWYKRVHDEAKVAFELLIAHGWKFEELDDLQAEALRIDAAEQQGLLCGPPNEVLPVFSPRKTFECVRIWHRGRKRMTLVVVRDGVKAHTTRMPRLYYRERELVVRDEEVASRLRLGEPLTGWTKHAVSMAYEPRHIDLFAKRKTK
jgi:hypothetical protein